MEQHGEIKEGMLGKCYAIRFVGAIFSILNIIDVAMHLKLKMALAKQLVPTPVPLYLFSLSLICIWSETLSFVIMVSQLIRTEPLSLQVQRCDKYAFRNLNC